MTARKKASRPRIPAHSSGEGGPASTSPWGSGWALWVGVVLLLASMAWRGHRAAVDAPVSVVVPGAVGGALVLAIQEADCPDRSRSMAEWVRTHSEALAREGIGLKVAVVGRESTQPTGPPDTTLPELPVLESDASARVGRSLLRMGVPGTPALLLLDSRGLPVLAGSFSPEGPGSGLELASRFGPFLDSEGWDTGPSIQRLEELRWNP